MRFILESIYFLLYSVVELTREGFCFLSSFAIHPIEHVNTWLYGLFAPFLGILPQTPDHLKLGSLLSSWAVADPFGYWFFSEIAELPIGLLVIALLVKAYKFLPFV